MQRYIYKVPVIDTKTLGIHKGRPHFFPILDPPPPLSRIRRIFALLRTSPIFEKKYVTFLQAIFRPLKT